MNRYYAVVYLALAAVIGLTACAGAQVNYQPETHKECSIQEYLGAKPVCHEVANGAPVVSPENNEVPQHVGGVAAPSQDGIPPVPAGHYEAPEQVSAPSAAVTHRKHRYTMAAVEGRDVEDCYPKASWGPAPDEDRPCDMLGVPMEDGSGTLNLGTLGRELATCTIPNPQEEPRHFVIRCVRIGRLGGVGPHGTVR